MSVRTALSQEPLAWIGLAGVGPDDTPDARGWQRRLHWPMIGVALLSMLLGEVSPGGVGVGLNGLLILALLAVFIAGLMVGRTPEFLGKKIQAAEMKLVVLHILVMPAVLLASPIANSTP